MNIPLPKVPSLLKSKRACNFCKNISPTSEPVHLNVEKIGPYIELNCFENVNSVIKTKGGNIEYGWLIWETLPDLMMEAEFHAIWIDINNVRHDITPKQFGIEYGLFLPDPTTKYENSQIDNIRIPLINDTLIINYIKNSEEYFRLTNDKGLAFCEEIKETKEIRTNRLSNIRIFSEIIKKYY